MIPRRWLPSIGWAALIVVGTSVPGQDVPVGPLGVDKVVHLLAYGVFGVLLLRAALQERPRAAFGRLAAAVLLFLASFAALDEWHQGFVPGRSPDVRDWVADLAGGVLATLLIAAARARREPST